MDKKTPSKPTKPTEDITSPELPITVYPQKRADSPIHDRREIQETPARPKAEVSTTSSAVQHRSQSLCKETDIDDGDIADNEHPPKGDPSLHRSVGKTMSFSSHYEKAKRAGKIDFINDWYPTGVSGSVLAKENEQKGREKTPEDKELPDEVPETPQPARKKQKMDDENLSYGDTATQLHSYLTEDKLQVIGHGTTTQKINSMDIDTVIKPTKHADSVPPHRSKLAHSSKTSTKDETQEANTSPGYKVSAQTTYDTKASFHASKQGPDDGLTPVFKHKVTPVKTGTETSNTKVSDHFSDGADTSEPKQSAKKVKVVKKGIAQIVKKKQKRGGWKYVDEY